MLMQSEAFTHLPADIKLVLDKYDKDVANGTIDPTQHLPASDTWVRSWYASHPNAALEVPAYTR